MFDSPFLYLAVCSTRNRVLSRLRRLRQPRYLVGAVVAVAYLYLVAFRRFSGRMRGTMRRSAVAIPPEVIAPVQVVGAFLLWALVLARWIVPVSAQPLQLSGAERDILLTAPVARRRLTRYKVMRSQIGVLLSTALMLVFAWRSVGSAWPFLLGMFLLFTTLRLHLLGVALTRLVLWRRGARADWAALVAGAVILVSSVGALWALAAGLVVSGRTGDVGAALLSVREVASRPTVALALLPYTLLVRPMFAAWPWPFLQAAAPVVVIVLLNYAWVLRSHDLMERSEVEIEHDTVEGRRAPARAAYRRAPFALKGIGRPEFAVAWKNLIMFGRYASLAMLLRIALPVVAVALMLGAGRRTDVASAALPFAAALSCGMTLLGPYSVRNDLRQDLIRLSVLKTWPISGERLLWGELLAPWAVVTAIVWLGIVVTGALALGVPARSLSWSARLAIGIAAALVLPSMAMAQLVVQNAAVVLFPGWVVIGPSRPRGVEAMGQQMLMFGGTMLLMVLGVLPGAVLGGLGAFIGYRFIGWFALVPAAVLVAALLALEIAVAVHLLGRVLDRTDASDVALT